MLMARSYQLDNPLAGRQGSPVLNADALREAIIQGRLTPGEPLRQAQLAQCFSVSRIPLREALCRLEGGGWIQFLPDRGARVSTLSAAEVGESCETRASLECTALELALPRHTPGSWREVEAALCRLQRVEPRARCVERNRDFHLALYAPAQRPRLPAMIESLHSRGGRSLRLKLQMQSLKRESDTEHQALYEARRGGDVRRARQILSSHLVQTGALLARHLGGREPDGPAAPAHQGGTPR
jgi:DNA-binding GntR family transcriptional regulator